jgi:hypothetical protein
VPDRFAILADIDDGTSAKRSDIMWLSSTCGIERSSIKRHDIIAAGNYRCFERREVRVAKVEQFGQ